MHFWGAMPSVFLTNEFWSALAGAIVGGMIGIIGQIMTIRANRAVIFDPKSEQIRAASISILYKIIKVHSNNFSVLLSFKDAVEKENTVSSISGSKSTVAEPWQIYMPLANVPAAVYFSDSEMNAILAEGTDELFNDIFQIEISHNALMPAVQTLRDESNKLRMMFMAYSHEDGMMSGHLSANRYREFLPATVLVNGLCRDTLSFSQENIKFAEKCAKNLRIFLKEKYDFQKNISFKSAPELEFGFYKGEEKP